MSVSFSLIALSLLTSKIDTLLLRYDAPSRSRLLWCAVTLPWFVSIFSVAVLVFPELFQWQQAWLISSLHWHHVYNFSMFSWHGASVILFSALSFFLLFSKLIKALKTTSNISQLNDLLKPKALPSGCILIESVS